jgi:hypothetical protein
MKYKISKTDDLRDGLKNLNIKAVAKQFNII